MSKKDEEIDKLAGEFAEALRGGCIAYAVVVMRDDASYTQISQADTVVDQMALASALGRVGRQLVADCFDDSRTERKTLP